MFADREPEKGCILSRVLSQFGVDSNDYIEPWNADSQWRLLAALRSLMGEYKNERAFRSAILEAEKSQIRHMRDNNPTVKCVNSVRHFLGLPGSEVGLSKVLLLGPMKFGAEVWRLRSSYILRDLMEPLKGHAHWVWLIPEPPEDAEEGIRKLAAEFNVSVYTFDSERFDTVASWTSAASSVIYECGGVDVVTNLQGHTVFGRVFGNLKRDFEFRASLRVAGDELASRVSLGSYGSMDSLMRDFLNEIFSFHEADVVLCMSTWERSRIARCVYFDSKVRIVHRGVDTNRFNPDREFLGCGKLRRLSGSSGSYKILYLGRKSSEKGWTEVARLAAESRRRNLEVEFVYAGAGFECESGEKETFLGFVDPEMLPELLKQVDAVILLSETEGLPQVIMEALSVGRLCFVRDHGYKAMWPGVSGIYNLPDDGSDVLNFMHGCLDNEDRQEVEGSMRDYARRHLDREVAGERYARHLLGISA